jgi:hypothetical protein
MSDKLMRRLVMDKTLRLGLPWLKAVLDAANVTRVTDLSHAQLVAAIEGRDL